MIESKIKQNRTLKTHHASLNFRESQFSDFYKPSVQQKQGEMIYVGASALAIGLAAKHFL